MSLRSLPIMGILRIIGVSLALLAQAGALTVDPGGAAKAGVQLSMALVEGHPAIAYSDSQLSTVKYVRALDADGSAWGTPVTVHAASALGPWVALRVVNGNPAVCYCDRSLFRMIFARADDSTGASWNTRVLIDIEPAMNLPFSMEVVDGRPAISVSGAPGLALRYVRAADANGAAWGPPISAAGTDPVFESSLKVVEGRPAIAWQGFGGLRYVRALDSAGTAWGTPVLAVPAPATMVYRSLSMQVVNGRPAASYQASSAGLHYVRAMDSTGAAWGEPVMVDGAQNSGQFSSLAVINGKPAIGYHLPAGHFDLKFAQAIDSDGAAGAWESAVTVESAGFVGMYTSLLEVNGRPALAYHNDSLGSLHYVRATGAGGNAQWPANLVVENPDRETIPRGSTRDFGNVPVGSTGWSSFILKNPNSGSVTLTGVTATIDGPDAAEFRITVQPPAHVPAEHTYDLSLIYAPVTPGLKSAVVHIISNAGDIMDSYDINLKASSVPDITVRGPSNNLVLDEGSLILPLTAPGAAVDFIFSVGNPGGADLSGLALTIDGPDAAEYSVAVPPAPTVAPGGNTVFTIRHAPSTEGGKTATLHLASNLTGNRNPFDLTLRMAAGTLDRTFTPLTSPVHSIALRANGRILAGGLNSIAGFNPNGSPDTSFFSPPVLGDVKCIATQKDGKILIGGTITQVNGKARQGIARLLPDGSPDEFLTPATKVHDIACLAVQADGKILAGGFMILAEDLPHRALARFHPDGSLDTGFAPHFSGNIICLAIQSDGKILAGGSFSMANFEPSNSIARLNPDGSNDKLFSCQLAMGVSSLAVQPDGKIFVAGGFNGGVVRLMPNGTRDPSMALVMDWDVKKLLLQADGKCVIPGNFEMAGGPDGHTIARIHPNGSLDATFAASVDGADTSRLTMQADGKILIGGDFSKIGGIARPNFARLDNDRATAFLNITDSAIRWMRGGSAPEVTDVSIDVKAAGSDEWTALGTGTPISGGWELSGISLPSAGSIRAQGFSGGSLMETVAPIPTAIERWRTHYFGSPSDTGSAAIAADPDGDGLINFVEFAFGLSPLVASSLPEFRLEGDTLSASFTVPEAAAEMILYSAEWSSELSSGPWTPIPDTGASNVHTFSAPGGHSRLFVRFVVKMR
ncbi:MAG TPA: choice-of-anchor D domain-containing protein [Verrucomicrobiales bacterium]|nr:choice-of-anchor D domain-containing protein [Verrucomicrobiales bacterium]